MNGTGMISKKTEQAVDSLANFANSFHPDVKGFSKAMRNQHRTLQQSVMATFVQLVNDWAEDYENNIFDGRNEETVKLASKLAEITKDAYLPMI